VADGKNARVILKPEFLQDIERPQRPLRYRIAWSTVPEYPLSGRLFQYIFGALRVLAKLIGRQTIDEPVPVGVTCKFMPAPDNLADQRRLPLGHPSKSEERSFYAGLVEKIQNTERIRLYPARPAIPRLAAHYVRKRLDLKIVLNIDGQNAPNLLTRHSK
jgi:hypothetical protein